jgi:hypothetical protein
MVEIDHFLQCVMHQALDEELLLSLLPLDQQPVSAPVAIAHVLRREAAEQAAQGGGYDDGKVDVTRVAADEVDHEWPLMNGCKSCQQFAPDYGDLRQLATAITITATTNSQKRFTFHVGLRATESSGEIFMATSSWE